MRACPAVLVALCWACEASLTHEGRTWLEGYGLEPDPADTRVAHLAWHAPQAECLQSYRITIAYDHNPPKEADSMSTLTIGRRASDGAGRAVSGVLERGEIFEGRLFYDPMLPGQAGTEREIFLSPELAGPAAPTSPCFPRTWDPMDDALALGWPRLPGRLTAVTEHWMGARVEGRCNRTACVDPETYLGGQDNRHRSCTTMDWDEHLVGILEIDGERYAAIESHWDDGHPLISAERRALVSVDHGRPSWAMTIIDHRPAQLGDDNSYAPVERAWTMESIDSCPGSLAAAGWRRPDEVVEIHERAEDRFREDKKTRRARVTEERRRQREAARNEAEAEVDQEP